MYLKWIASALTSNDTKNKKAAIFLKKIGKKKQQKGIKRHLSSTASNDKRTDKQDHQSNESLQRIQIATRGSDLALYQTELVIELLKEHQIEGIKKIVKTQGDKNQESFCHLSGDGFFTKELELELLSGESDLAVHSAKDLPSLQHAQLPWGVISPRGSTKDLLIAHSHFKELEVPRIGTGSPRRRAQILKHYPKSRLIDLRGNIPTRIEKLKNKDYDAIVLAKIALERLNLLDTIKDQGLHIQELDEITAPGQGLIAVQANQSTEQILNKIIDLELTQIVYAEKSVLEALGSGCHTPVGAHCKRENSSFFFQYFGEIKKGKYHTIQTKGKTLSESLSHLLVKITEATKKEIPKESDLSHKKLKLYLCIPLPRYFNAARICAQKGATALPLPMTQIKISYNIKQFETIIESLHEFEGILFTSVIGVQTFCNELSKEHSLPETLKDIPLFAIGQATASKIEEYKVKATGISRHPYAQGLTALLKEYGQTRPFLFPGTKDSLLLTFLKQEDIRHFFLEMYRSYPYRGPLKVTRLEPHDRVLFTSPSSVREFIYQYKVNIDIQTLNLYAIGDATAQALERAGFKAMIPDQTGNMESLIEKAMT